MRDSAQPKHIINVSQFTEEFVKDIFRSAKAMEECLRREETHRTTVKRIENKILYTLFYEESTRTRSSFEAAFYRLGGRNIISATNAAQFSSAAKGESLKHTLQVLSALANPDMRLADAIVLRSPNAGDAQIAACNSTVPIINAGDGAGEHPTQALLDLYFLQKHFGGLEALEGKTIAFSVGYGRAAFSLARLLIKYRPQEIIFVGIPGLSVPSDIQEKAEQEGVEYTETDDLREVAYACDVIYVMRHQRNHIHNAEAAAYYYHHREKYCVSEELYATAERAVFMHPMPIDRKEGNEIPEEIEVLPRVMFLRQAACGLPVRMALLKHVLVDDNSPQS